MTRQSPVRRPVHLLAPVTVLLALALAGCGGDDDGSGGGGGDTGGGDAGDVPALQGESCDSEVTLTGAVEAEWSGDATVDVSGDSDVAPPATYQSNHDGYMLTVSAIGNGFDDPVVILLADGDNYGVTPGEGSVQVEPDGSGATVDAPAAGVGVDGTVQVEATFSC